ncbi:hypothetical protein [Calothrix sp. PCC 6303]|nr:hypothetical protein [Calothrix sp. PCC 6303]
MGQRRLTVTDVEEIHQAITSCDTLKFIYNRPLNGDISEDT